MYLYDDVALSIVSNLNTRILNMSFSKLADNDTSILPVNEYAPKIWENKWFNDNTVAGYAKGDAVWKYTMTLETFLSNYNTLIYDYANENHILNGYFKFGEGEYDKNEEETARYLNVISGYGENKPIVNENGNVITNPETGEIELSWHLILPPLFDYGAYISTSNLPIEIYVSLIDNNKALLSDSLAWTNITLSNILAFRQYISAELSLMIDEHIKHYHLDGVNTSAEFAEILLKRDFSNFDISALYNAQHMTSHSKYINDLGFDYVVEFIKEPTYTTISGTSYELYRWCRLWNSGHLEHGGIVEMPKYTYVSSTSVSNYTLSVDLNWPKKDTLLYDYPVCADFYGLTANNLYFANDVELRDYSLSNGVKLTNRYSISLTPVQFNGNDIDTTTDPLKLKLKSEADISKVTYPTSANLDRNKTFVNFEVHSITNNSFYITRSRTDNLQDNDTIRYVLYYTSGYRTSIVKSYNMLSCVVKHLSPFYAYTGNEITPDIRVYANNGEEMREGIDYTIRYHNNIGPTLSATIELEGILPYYGILPKSFGIKYELKNDEYEIVNVPSAYKFQP